MPKKPRRKWNRAHYFARKKSTPRQVGHPVFVYGKRGKYRKYLTFTHKPEKGKEVDFEQLLHNIDPNDSEDCYVKKQYSFSHEDSLRPPDKKYRIHQDDIERVNKYKK